MVLASIPASFLGSFAIAKKETKTIVLGYRVFPFLKIIILFSFIYLWDIPGAIWGLNLSAIIQAVLLWSGISSENLPQE